VKIPLEIKVIERFVIKDKQSRYIQFVSSKSARVKFLRDLSHFNFLKWDLFEEVNGNHSEILDRIHLLKGDNTSCYVISEIQK
jgi:hypothetical protein